MRVSCWLQDDKRLITEPPSLPAFQSINPSSSSSVADVIPLSNMKVL